MSDFEFPVPDDPASQQIWHILSMRYGVFPKLGMKLVGEWLHNHPEESTDSLKEYLMSNRILVKQGRFLDLRQISQERLAELIDTLQSPQGIVIKDRWHLARKYPKCFLGRDVVACFQAAYDISKAEAIRLGELLFENRVLHHVLDDHPFKNEALFYRFYSDETVMKPESSLGQ